MKFGWIVFALILIGIGYEASKPFTGTDETANLNSPSTEKDNSAFPQGVTLFGDIKTGMSYYEFRSWFLKAFHAEPRCGGDFSSGRGSAGYTCQGEGTLENVPTTFFFHFGDNALFALGMDFDPEYFDGIKNVLSQRYGLPDSDEACNDAKHEKELDPSAVATLQGSLGCENLTWGNKLPVSILLSQVPIGLTHERVSIMPKLSLGK